MEKSNSTEINDPLPTENIDRELIELTFSAKNLSLKSKKKINPRVTVYWREEENFAEVGRTETLNNTNDPFFKTPIEIPFIFQKQQDIKIIVENVEENSKELIGSIQDLELGAILGTGKRGYIRELYSEEGSPRGEILIEFQRLENETEEYYIDLR